MSKIFFMGQVMAVDNKEIINFREPVEAMMVSRTMAEATIVIGDRSFTMPFCTIYGKSKLDCLEKALKVNENRWRNATHESNLDYLIDRNREILIQIREELR
jgi:hypothetical protein